MKKYFVVKNNKQKGPLNIEEVVSLLGSAKLTLTDFIFDELQNDWVMLMAHEDLTQHLESLKPQLPPPSFNLSKAAVVDVNTKKNEDVVIDEKPSSFPNESYKKNLIDEVRSELNTNTVDLSKFSDENISGPITPSNFEDLIESNDQSALTNNMGKTQDIPIEALKDFDKTQDIPVNINEPTQEVIVNKVEPHDKIDAHPIKDLGEPIAEEDLIPEIPSLSFDTLSESEAEPPVYNFGSAENEKTIETEAAQSDLGQVMEKKLPVDVIDAGSTNEIEKNSAPLVAGAVIPMSKAFSSVDKTTSAGKIEEIKNGKGSLKEKALKISKALEEAEDPIMSEWYVLKDHNKYGPYTYKDMLNMMDEKFIYGFDFAWHKSLSNWRRIESLEAFQVDTKKRLQNSYMPELTKIYNRRRHKRVNFGHSIMIHDNVKMWKGESVEISVGGVSVVMSQAHISPGQTLYLHFKPGDGVPPFNAACEVLSKRPQQNAENKKLEVLYGMKFLSISSDVNHLVSSISQKKSS